MIQSHAESIKKIMRVLQDLPANQHSQSSPIPQIMAELAVLVSWQILKGPKDFHHTLSMALYHKLDVKKGFAWLACASKQDVFELATLQYPIQIFKMFFWLEKFLLDIGANSDEFNSFMMFFKIPQMPGFIFRFSTPFFFLCSI